MPARKHAVKSIMKGGSGSGGGSIGPDTIVVSTHHLTLGLVVLIGGLVLYLYYVMFGKRGPPKDRVASAHSTVIMSPPSGSTPLNDPYVPPTTDVGLVRRVPINVPTSTVNTAYSQVGILTKNDNLILPLMGRNLWNGRDKWQYYSMSNTGGEIHTKLPVRVNGKSGSSEYGCDSISTGDMVFVDGYNDQFRATVYETSLLQYLPF